MSYFGLTRKSVSRKRTCGRWLSTDSDMPFFRGRTSRPTSAPPGRSCSRDHRARRPSKAPLPESLDDAIRFGVSPMISYDATLDRAVIRPVGRVFGSPSLPSDKSIAHRAALFAAVGDGTSDIINFPRSADPRSTLACISQLGTEIEEAGDELRIHGRGLHGLSAPSAPLDAGNSGTTMRLLAGLLAGQTFDSTIQGDESLNRRPMERIAKPLRQMGASLHLTEGHAPIRSEGGHRLHGITYRLPIPSAQVKSCVLLAGLYAKGPTTVIEESV